MAAGGEVGDSGDRPGKRRGEGTIIYNTGWSLFFIMCRLFKANEPRKPADRKAVKKAYENALQYESQVNGPDASGATS